jgi:hypothetical protein
LQYDDALAHVRDHLTRAQVHRLRHAISLRHGILRDLRAALVTVSADIEITGQIDGMRYATGLTGTVQAIYDDKYADLLLDSRSTKALATGKGASTHPGAADVERYQLSGMPLGAFTATGVDEAFADLIGYLLTQATEQQLTELSTARARRTDQLAADLKPRRLGDAGRHEAEVPGRADRHGAGRRPHGEAVQPAAQRGVDRPAARPRPQQQDRDSGRDQGVPAPAVRVRLRTHHQHALTTLLGRTVANPPARAALPLPVQEIPMPTCGRPAHEPTPTRTGIDRRRRMSPRLRHRSRLDRRRPRRRPDQRKPSAR